MPFVVKRFLKERLAPGSDLLRVGVLFCGLILPFFSGCDRPDTSTPTKQSTTESVRSEPIQPPPAPPGGFVGSIACAECHADIAESYQSHPMAHSLSRVLEAPVEDYDGVQKFEISPGYEYLIEASPEGVTHTERFLDEEDNTIYEQEVPVQFAIGSGKRGRSYLINRNGPLYMSPVTWYTEGQRFDLSPGYAEQSHPRFSRRLSDGCLTCHSGRTASLDDGPHRFESSPFLEKSIGCERCHGPGQDHISFHQSGSGEAEKEHRSDPIVNPARLSLDLSDEICYQCHLQGVERVLRYGRSEYDFRPGDRLIDIWAIFVEGNRINRENKSTRAVSQVEQMHESQCYQLSQGQFGCTSCHDPHSSPTPRNRVDFFRRKCLACHEQQITDCSAPQAERLKLDNSCIDCHMPKLDASDVPHTSQTDHRVLKYQSRALQDSESTKIPNQPTLFLDAEEQLSPESLQRVRGIFLAHTAVKTQNPMLGQQAFSMLEPLTSRFTKDVELLDTLGDVSYLLRDADSAETFWREAREIQPARESAIEGLMLVARRRGHHREALQLVNQLLELNSWEERFYHHQSQLLLQLGRHSEAIQSAARGLENHPNSVPLYRNLIEMCRQAKQEDRAEKYENQLEKILNVVPAQLP